MNVPQGIPTNDKNGSRPSSLRMQMPSFRPAGVTTLKGSSFIPPPESGFAHSSKPSLDFVEYDDIAQDAEEEEPTKNWRSKFRHRSDSHQVEDPHHLIESWTTGEIPGWVDAEQEPQECCTCRTPFKKGHRHNCRLCGLLYCSNCTGKYNVPKSFKKKGKKGPVRVCWGCRNSCLQRHLDAEPDWENPYRRPRMNMHKIGPKEHIFTPHSWAESGSYQYCWTCNQGLPSHPFNCRVCGELFCKECTTKQEMPYHFKKRGKTGPVRICLECRFRAQSGAELNPGDVFDATDTSAYVQSGPPPQQQAGPPQMAPGPGVPVVQQKPQQQQQQQVASSPPGPPQVQEQKGPQLPPQQSRPPAGAPQLNKAFSQPAPKRGGPPGGPPGGRAGVPPPPGAKAPPPPPAANGSPPQNTKPPPGPSADYFKHLRNKPTKADMRHAEIAAKLEIEVHKYPVFKARRPPFKDEFVIELEVKSNMNLKDVNALLQNKCDFLGEIPYHYLVKGKPVYEEHWELLTPMNPIVLGPGPPPQPKAPDWTKWGSSPPPPPNDNAPKPPGQNAPPPPPGGIKPPKPPTNNAPKPVLARKKTPVERDESLDEKMRRMYEERGRKAFEDEQQRQQEEAKKEKERQDRLAAQGPPEPGPPGHRRGLSDPRGSVFRKQQRQANKRALRNAEFEAKMANDAGEEKEREAEQTFQGLLRAEKAGMPTSPPLTGRTGYDRSMSVGNQDESRASNTTNNSGGEEPTKLVFQKKKNYLRKKGGVAPVRAKAKSKNKLGSAFKS